MLRRQFAQLDANPPCPARVAFATCRIRDGVRQTMTLASDAVEPARRRVLVAGCALLALFIVVGAFAMPALIRGSYHDGQGVSVLRAHMPGRDALSADHYVDAWLTRLLSSTLGFGLALTAFAAVTTPWFYQRFVRGPGPRELATVRIVVASILLVNTLWEDLASTSLLPRGFIHPMGVVGFLYHLPGFGWLAGNGPALRVFQLVVTLLLAMAALGYRARLSVPLAAITAVVMGGLLRQYCHFFHAMLVPLLLLCVLSFSPCADALSWDAHVGRTRSADSYAPYAWFRFAAFALIALSYSAAGTSKLQNGGLMWWSGNNLKSYVLADALANRHFQSGLGLKLANVPAVYFAPLGLLSVLGETSFVAVLVSTWARRVIPAVMLGMHVGIFLLQNILFPDMMVILVALFVVPSVLEALHARRLRTQSEEETLQSPAENWAGQSGWLACGIALFVAFLFCWGMLRFEYYPLSAFQMYAGHKTSSIILYDRVLAIHRSGREHRARMERGAWALADGRWRDNLGLAFNPATRSVFQEYLDAIAPMLSADTPADPIVGFAVEHWEWDYDRQPASAHPGRRLERVEFRVSSRSAGSQSSVLEGRRPT